MAAHGTSDISTAMGATTVHAVGRDDSSKLPLVVTIYIICLVTPLIFDLGPIRLSAYRLVLLAMFFPALHVLFSGKVGPIRTPDICVMLICFWSSISLIYHHGFADMIEPIGIFLIETMGAYMLGRCYVRTPDAFFQVVRLCFIITLVFLPFAVFEAVTGTNLVLKFFDLIGQTYHDVYKDRRLGLDRAQGPFSHPIHFGVFFGGLVGLTYYVLGYGRSMFGRLLRTLTVACMGALALSSGPLAALVAQVYFIIWDVVFRSIKSRWYILISLSFLGYLAVDLLSNRNPFVVFISYLAFNAHTAYNRVLIWRWGTKNIFDNPVFGIGYNPWERQSWMTGSFDMFWLLPAMQHGIPVWILYNVLFFWLFIKIARFKTSNPRISAYRVGYASSMFGLFMSGWTVHYWDATFVFFLFLMSSGFWILYYKDEGSHDIVKSDEPSEGRIRYSRFRRKSRHDGSGSESEALAVPGTSSSQRRKMTNQRSFAASTRNPKSPKNRSGSS